MIDLELPNQIIGGSVFVNGHLQNDENSELIHRLTSGRFVRLVDSESDWTTLFLDPIEGRYWEISYPHGERHGGGPPRLDAIPNADVVREYGRLPDQDEWIAKALKLFDPPRSIVGGTIVSEGRTVNDKQTDLIQILVRNRFDRLADRERGWTELYRDRVSGTYFELTLRLPSVGERRPLRLDRVTDEQIRERYGRIPEH